jgi:hypothetical protein
MRYAPVPMVDNGKRAIRIFGGRKTVRREDNGGVCDPEACSEYQKHECNLSGRFLFFIPGIRSVSAFELHTTSFYAMNAALRKFEAIAFLRGGRISGFLDRQQTPFWLSKRLVEVSHIDEKGQAVRLPQWIIELEAPVDVAALLRENDDDDAVIVDAEAANRLLEGRAPGVESAGDFLPTGGDGGESGLDGQRSNGNGLGPRVAETRAVAAAAETVRQRRANAEAKAKAAAEPNADADADADAEFDLPPAGQGGEPTFAQLLGRVAAMGLATNRFEAYAVRRWGSGWKLNRHGRRRAWDELERFRNDAAGYIDKIETEMRAAS